MNTFSRALQTRLDNLPAAKELLTSSATRHLRANCTRYLGFPYMMCCTMWVFVPFCLVGYELFSQILWLGWSAVAVGLVVWGLKFGVWLPKAVQEWNKTAKLVGLGWISLLTEIKDTTAARKVEIIEDCAKSGATPAQIKRLYAITKDCDLPRQWWWELHSDSESIPANELFAQQQQKQHREEAAWAAQQEMLARLKIKANS